jgi:hypothetical protein
MKILDRHPTVEMKFFRSLAPFNWPKDWVIKSGNAKATHLTLLHIIVCGVELGGLFLDQRPPFCEQGLTPVTHKMVIAQILVLVEEVVDLLKNCATPLLDATNWILSNFHPCLAKAHILKLGEVVSSTRCSFGDLTLLVLEQGCLVDGDWGGMGATLGSIMLRLGAHSEACCAQVLPSPLIISALVASMVLPPS